MRYRCDYALKGNAKRTFLRLRARGAVFRGTHTHTLCWCVQTHWRLSSSRSVLSFLVPSFHLVSRTKKPYLRRGCTASPTGFPVHPRAPLAPAVLRRNPSKSRSRDVCGGQTDAILKGTAVLVAPKGQASPRGAGVGGVQGVRSTIFIQLRRPSKPFLKGLGLGGGSPRAYSEALG